MTQSSFFQRFGWHIPYWVVIMGLIGWIVWGRLNDRSSWLNQASLESMTAAREIVHERCQQKFSEINNLTKIYPSERSTKFDSIARRAVRMVDQFNERLETIKGQFLDEKFPGTKPPELQPDQISWLEEEALLLKDSLVLLIDNEPFHKSSFFEFMLADSSLPNNWLPEYLSNAQPDKVALTLENIITRTEIAKFMILDHLLSQGCIIDITFDSYAPIVSAKNPAPRVGELYEADIFLAPYYDNHNDNNMRMQVNGQELRVRDGAAHFSTRYTEPGKKLYTVTIQIRNLLTGEVKASTKEFTLHVLPSDTQ